MRISARLLSHLLSLAFLSGCGEHWYSFDNAEIKLSGPAHISVRVSTTPEAWPEDLYDDAVRATFTGEGRLFSADPRREILQVSESDVNILDAWEDCPLDEDCVKVFSFDVVCHGPCAGNFQVDAFMATSPFPEPDRGGSLDIEILEPSDCF